MVSEPTPDYVSARRLFPQEVDTRRVPVRTLVPKGGGFGGVPHRLKKETSVNENTGPGVDCDIPHWLGRRTKHPFKGVETFP